MLLSTEPVVPWALAVRWIPMIEAPQGYDRLPVAARQ